jgi:ABC-type branched-subunit amino acid transport system substrate-binding protein
VTIGYLGALTGPLAFSQVDFLKGLQAAVAYLNAGNAKAKNVHYAVVSRDTGANPVTDEADARQLTQSGVRYFLGDDITSTGFAAEQIAFNQVHAISFSSVPGVFDKAGMGKIYPWAYGIGPTDSTYEDPPVNTFGPKSNGKIAIIYEDYQDVLIWGQTAAALAKKDGYNVTSQSVSITSTDDTAELRTLQASGADTLIIFAVANPYTILQDMVQIGWYPKYVAGAGPQTAQQAATLPSKLVDNIVTQVEPPTLLAATAGQQATDPNTIAYFKYYAPMAGEVPGKFDNLVTLGSYSFDMALILDEAIGQAGSTSTSAVQTALDSGTIFHASRGEYQYGADQRYGPVSSTYKLQKYTASCPYGICVEYSG